MLRIAVAQLDPILGDFSGNVERILLAAQEARAQGASVLLTPELALCGNPPLDYLLRMLRQRNPATLHVCTLLDKRDRREIEVPIDYVGFEVPDAFVVGYGLDYAEHYRQLPFIGVLKPEIYE